LSVAVGLPTARSFCLSEGFISILNPKFISSEVSELDSLEKTMPIKLCHHIKEDGILCGSAALHGRDYCYFHLTFRGRRTRIAQHRRRNESWRLELPPLEDLNAVQVGIMQVLDAITEGLIERRDAGHLLYGLQSAACNLRGKDHSSFEVRPDVANRCVAYDSFEEDFELTEAETLDDSAPDVPAARPESNTPLAPAREEGEEGVAVEKQAAAESSGGAHPAPIIIDRLMAVADDNDDNSPPDADSALIEQPTPKKQPRGLRPPLAIRLSAEEAAALTKEQQRSAPECGCLDDGEIVPCSKCEVLVFKRLAQFWESRNNGDDWLPFTGTIDCLDCQLKHLTTLGKHLKEEAPVAFHLYMILKTDGGEDPGTFDEYFFKSKAYFEQTGQIPEDWRERYRRYKKRSNMPETKDEEDKASA
jgi:hypothetical protein